MSSDLIQAFLAYKATHALDRVRMSSVPDQIKPLVSLYREKLSAQLADPENQSWSVLGPDEHANALSWVLYAYAPKKFRPVGNCPRCAGSGFILAFSHVRGGECLRCSGTGNCAQ